MIIPAVILLSLLPVEQTRSLLPNKTLADSVFTKGDIIRIPILDFDLSFPINPGTVDSLIPVADFLRKHPNLKVEIALHTDIRGSVEGNNALSAFRASHVRKALVEVQHIDPSRLTYKGYGETVPIISEEEIINAKTNEERERLHALNRRTELVVVDIE